METFYVKALILLICAKLTIVGFGIKYWFLFFINYISSYNWLHSDDDIPSTAIYWKLDQNAKFDIIYKANLHYLKKCFAFIKEKKKTHTHTLIFLEFWKKKLLTNFLCMDKSDAESVSENSHFGFISSLSYNY